MKNLKNNNALKLFKQTFFSAFKHKVQITVLILLTFILSVFISLTWITIKWLNDGQTAMNSSNAPFTYSYRFNSKHTIARQSIAPTFNIFAHYGASVNVSSELENNGNDNKLNISTPIITIAKSKDNLTESSGDLLPLNADNLELTNDIDVNGNITIKRISFKDLLKLEQINANSSNFRNSLIGQILKTKYSNNIDNHDFKVLYDQYRLLVEDYINPIFSFYLTNLYKSNSNDPDLNYATNISNPEFLKMDINFKEQFLAKFVNCPDDNSQWTSYIDNNSNLGDDNLPIFGGGDDTIKNQLTLAMYNTYFPDKNNFNKKAFFKNGFKGTLGNLLMNITNQGTNSNQISLETLNDHTPTTSQTNTRHLTINVGGSDLKNNWNDNQLMWAEHNKLLGKLTNFAVNLRKEYLFSDFANNTRYRIIAIDTNSKVKILQGVAPVGTNQIVVSPQFAKINHKKIGSTIKIGGYNLVITGIGGDDFTTLPVVDEVNFLPNPKKEALVFVSKELFIQDDFILYSDSTDISQVYLNYLGTNKDVDSKLLKLFLNDNFSFSNNNIIETTNKIKSYIVKPNDLSTITTDLKISSDIKDSDSSYFINRGFESLPLAVKTYTWFSIGVVIFIVILVIFATILIIRRAIEKSSSEIGVMKALGYKSKQIILSYLAYAGIVCLIAVLPGWIIGSVLQLAIMKVIENFFILPFNIFYLDPLPLVISILIVGGVIILTVILTALQQLSRPIPNLLHPNSDVIPSKTILRIYHRYFAFGSFKTRFKLVLASISYKKIIIMFVTILIASFTIATALMIPAAVRSLNDSYYGLLKYENGIDFVTPISNMPLSRYSLYPWQGIDAVNDESDYPIAENKPLADYYKEDSEWKLLSENINNVTVESILKQMSYNYYWTGGRAISLGWLNKVSKDFKDNAQLSAVFSSIICPITNSILSTNKPIASNSNDWKKCTLEAIENAVPAYIKEFLNSEERKNRLVISHNTTPFNTKEDELFTHYEAQLQDTLFKAVGLKPDSAMVLLGNNKQYLSSINNDLTEEIPIIINRTMQNKYNLKANSTFVAKTQQQQLKYLTKNNTWQPIDQSAWQYRDGSEDIYSMPLDKWSLDSGDGSYGWSNRYDYKYLENGDSNNKIQSYRNLNEVTLRLPKDGPLGLESNFLQQIKDAKIPTNNDKQIVEVVTHNNQEWWLIRPFAPLGRNETYVSKEFLKTPFNVLNQSYDQPLWNIYIAMLQEKTVNNQQVPKLLDISNKAESSISYRIKGFHESYGEPTIFLNQKVANNILGFKNISSKTIYNKDPFNEELLWFNGRYSKNPELIDVTTRYSTTSSLGDYTISSISYNIVNSFENGDLVSVKKAMINNLTNIASGVAAIFILGTISLSVIFITMISNLVVHQFAKLMGIMKVQGYKYREINSLTLSMFIPTSMIGFGFGFAIAWFVCQGLLWTVGKFTGVFIPLYFQWWLLPITFVIIVVIYATTYIISTQTLKNMNVLELVKSSDE